MKMSKEKRIATISYGDGEIQTPIEIDVDEHWNGVLERTPEERLNFVSSPFHFLIHLQHMELPTSIKDRFYAHYCKPSAVKARDVARWGLVASNYNNELSILYAVDDFNQRRIAGCYKDRPGLFDMDMLRFCIGFAEIVRKRDVSALRRMVKILENGGLPQGERGGLDSEDGCMLEKFVELHLQSRSLPTKKALREACKIGGLNPEEVAAARMKKLGLSGLPEKTEI
ncbi:MAG: hypothetical protein ACO3JG_08905 [Luteolibacter sp.]